MEEASSGGPPPPPPPHSSSSFPPLSPRLSSGLLPTPAPNLSDTPKSPPPSLPTTTTTTTKLSSSSLWSDLFIRASKIPKNFPPPKISSDGTPIVRAPPSIILKSSETWKDFIICNFFGDPPTHKKIFADLNPIWGKKGSIQIQPYSSKACLILIPNPPMREWVLDVGFWSAGTVAFSTTPWTPTSTLSEQPLTSAPVSLALLNVPPQLWSSEGFAIIASGVGDPLPPKNSVTIPQMGQAPARVRAVVPLDQGPLPSSVIVEDDNGNQVQIEVLYQNLPPLCPSCNQYGHRAHRCPLRPRLPPPPSSNKSVRTSSQSVTVPSVQSPVLNTTGSFEALGFTGSGPISPKGPSAPIQARSATSSAHHNSLSTNSPTSSAHLPPQPDQTHFSSILGPLPNSAHLPNQIDIPAQDTPTNFGPPSVSTPVPISATDTTTSPSPSPPTSIPPQPVTTSSSSLPDHTSPSPTTTITDDLPTLHPTTHLPHTSPPVTSTDPINTTSPSPYGTPSSSEYPISPHRLPFTSPPSSSFTSLLLRQIEVSQSPTTTISGSHLSSHRSFTLPSSSISPPPIHNHNHIIFEDADEEVFSEDDPTDELEESEYVDYDHSISQHDIDFPHPHQVQKGRKSSKKKKRNRAKEHLNSQLPPFFPLSKRLL